jgi:hypothetical protein
LANDWGKIFGASAAAEEMTALGTLETNISEDCVSTLEVYIMT